MFHLLRRKKWIYILYTSPVNGYIISPLGSQREQANALTNPTLSFSKNLSLEMLQLTLAVRRGVGFGRLSAAAMRWHSTPAPSLDLSEGEREIYQKLTDKFSPTTLRVQDISGTLLSRG